MKYDAADGVRLAKEVVKARARNDHKAATQLLRDASHDELVVTSAVLATMFVAGLRHEMGDDQDRLERRLEELPIEQMETDVRFSILTAWERDEESGA